MGLFQPTEQRGYIPFWKNPAPCPAEPAAQVVNSDDESLNRLQRLLIWFAAVLIAISMFQNFRNNF